MACKLSQKIKCDPLDHRALVLWGCLCAEHVLPVFERVCPKDDRVWKVIQVGRAWALSDEGMKMKEIRGASLGAHAAARGTENLGARYAARSAGQAVATVHVAEHVFAAAMYALKSAEAAGIKTERAWQICHLPKKLHKDTIAHLKSRGVL